MTSAAAGTGAPRYEWATHTGPDFLVVQLTGTDQTAIRTLFATRGFRTVVETDDLDLRPSNGCLLTRLADSEAELLVTVGASGASRIPLPGIDATWLARAVTTGHAAVLLATSAIRDGGVTKDDLTTDVESGHVLAALLPVADREA